MPPRADDPSPIGIVPKVAAGREAVSIKTIYRWLWSGRLFAKRLPNGWRISVDSDGHVRFRGERS